MEPTDRIGDDVTLYLGDAMAVLPTLAAGSVDAVVTDPPYGTEAARDGYGRRQLGAEFIANDSDLSMLDGMLAIVPRLLRPDSWVLVFVSPKRRHEAETVCRARGFSVKGEVVWDKGMAGLGGGIRYQHETVLLLARGKPAGRDALFSVIRETYGFNGNPRHHPHEKPVALMRNLVRYACPPGGCVLDPFCGSGSTLMAAVREGMTAIGVELDPGHYEAARRRLVAATGAGPGQLFGAYPGEG